MWSSRKKIFDELNLHYPENIEFLPSSDPYVFLVTVMLSGSSTDKMAIKSASKLFEENNTPEYISALSEAEIEAKIHSSGLAKTKAHNIKAVSQYIAHNGIPNTLEELVRLPGIGEKSASCYIASILHHPAVIADTHFMRVARRLGLIATDDRSKAVKEIKEYVPEECWTRLSMTVNLHGREVCKARCDCSKCFLAYLCPSREI